MLACTVGAWTLGRETFMRLSLRSLIGMSAAFATMAVVLGSAFLAPAEPSETVASTCPQKMKASATASRPRGA
jgi:hypothetical protein